VAWATALAVVLLMLSVVSALVWPGQHRGIDFPPTLSGEEDTLVGVQRAHSSVLRAQPAYERAEQAVTAASTLDGRPYTPESEVGTVRIGGAAAAAALQRAIAYGHTVTALATAAATYQAAIEGYDDALMARSRGLGPKSEALRSATWPFVEYVKRFPPPLGLDTTLHPVSPAELAALLQKLQDDRAVLDASGAGPGQAAADLAQLAPPARDTVKLAGFLPEYQRLLDMYAGRVEQVAATRESAASGLKAAVGYGLAVLLLAALAAGAALLFWSRAAIRRRRAAPAAMPALAVALVLAGYLVGPTAPAAMAALGYGIVALLSPVAAMVGLVTAIPFFFHPRAVLRWHFPPAELALGLLCCAIALRWIAGRREFLRRELLHLSRTDVLALLFLLAGTVSLLVPDHSNLHVALRSYRVVIVEPVVFYAVFTRLMRRGQGLWWALDAFIVVLAVVGWLAAAQFLTGSDTWSSGGVARAIGVEPSPTALGIELGRGVTLALCLALFHPSRRSRVGYGLLAIPGAAGLLASFTRGAWIAVGVAVAATVGFRRRWRLLAGLACLTVLAFAVLATSHLERLAGLFSLQSGSSAARLEIWRGALRMVREHPLQGIGLDQFLAQNPTRYGIPELRFLVVSHPHNILLDAWLQLGLLGALVSVALVVSTLAAAIRLARCGRDGFSRVWGLALLAAMAEVVVHGMVDEGYFTGDLALTFWLIVAAVEVLRQDEGVREEWTQQAAVERELAVSA